VSVLDFLWVPILVLGIASIPFVLRGVYPDVFIKETA
jgi:hypothetical protein